MNRVKCVAESYHDLRLHGEEVVKHSVVDRVGRNEKDRERRIERSALYEHRRDTGVELRVGITENGSEAIAREEQLASDHQGKDDIQSHAAVARSASSDSREACSEPQAEVRDRQRKADIGEEVRVGLRELVDDEDRHH